MNPLQKTFLENALKHKETLKLYHPLKQLFWECTLKCNMACRHCGSDCKTVSNSSDMPFEDFSKVLDTIAQHQKPNSTLVSTVGGEPLLRPDIIECGYNISKKGFIWGMVSNGMLIDGHIMKQLHKAGLRTIAVDVDGIKDDHNWLRCNESSFDRVFEAIKHLRNTPHLTWDVITCVNKRNYTNLNELKRLLIDAGVKKWRCFTISPMGRAKNQEDLFLSHHQFKGLMDFIANTRKEGKIKLSYSCEGFLGDYEGQVRDYIFTCISGLTVASILNDGGISGCLSVRSQFQQGNIYKDDFWDIWNNKFECFRNRNWMKTNECAECENWRYCEGNGFHLRNDDGSLMLCHYNKLKYNESHEKEK